jgi:hypothetical protein
MAKIQKRAAATAKKHKRGKLVVTAEFLGNGALAPAAAQPATVRYG